MRQKTGWSVGGGLWRTVLAGTLLVVLAAGSAGIDCDSDAVTAFRQESADEIGDGINTILTAITDGVVAAIVDAGDGATEEDQTE